MKIKFIDRGFDKNLVLIPGWAADYRIFGTLELDYNYFIPYEFDPFNAPEELKQELQKKELNAISVLGWSLGGYIAAEFACGHKDKIRELFLLSVREKFEPEVLNDVESKIKADKKAYLRKLYSAFFSDSENYQQAWFKKSFLKTYIKEMEANSLITGLNYLRQAKIDTAALSGLKDIIIFHGTKDKIAPLTEASSIQSRIPQAKLITVEGGGHLPFLNNQFPKWISRQ